jgi:hypothetical protein
LLKSIDPARDYALLFAMIKYLFNVLIVLFILLAVFGYKFISFFAKKFWKLLLLFAAVAFAFYFLQELFQRVWFYLSVVVTHAVGFLLRLSFSEVFMKVSWGQAPRLGVPGFRVGISKECSGIDSLLLFISLYVFIGVLNWKDINKKRFALLFVFGLIGTFVYNILRVYLIMLVGIFVSPRFAIDTFHTNIGWILFLALFAIFWHFGSGFIHEKPEKKQKRKKKK